MHGQYPLAFQRVAVITPPFPLQEAARCQLSASSSRSRSGPTSSVCADSLVRGLLGGRKLRFIMVFPPSPGMANRKIELDRRAYEQYSDLTAKKMTVGWTYGRLMVASLPRGQDCFRTGTLSAALRCACCWRRVLYYLGSHFGLVVPIGNRPVYFFGVTQAAD